jgi:uncharacterized protein YjbI with pentapeptide repeats
MKNESTQTNSIDNRSEKICNLTLKNILRFASSLLLPLALGIFTVIITFHQEKIAAKQRADDKESAYLLRELERSLANEQYQNESLDNSIFRQLDSQRNGRIIRFLYESGQLNENKEYSPLDLSTTELRNIDFSVSSISSSLESLSLSGMYLINVTFHGANLCKSNFSGSQLVDVKFSKTIILIMSILQRLH